MTTTSEEISERKPGKIYFIMTTLPGPHGEFVELEDADGRGLGLGSWVKLAADRYALELDDPRGEYNTSTDLSDDEMELIHVALCILGGKTNEADVKEKCMALIGKLGLEVPPEGIVAALGLA